MTALERPVVNTNDGGLRCCGDMLLAVALKQTKNRFPADRDTEMLRQTSARGTAERQAHMPQHTLRAGCAALLARDELWKAFGKRSPATPCVVAAKAPDMYFQRHAMTTTRQVLHTSSVTPVYPRTRCSASRAMGNKEFMPKCNDEPIADHLPSKNTHTGSGQQASKEGKIHAGSPSDAISA